MKPNTWIAIIATLMLAAGIWSCGDDDDGAGDAGTDTDTDTDIDTDTDTDTDSDTEVTYDGTLHAEVLGAGVNVYMIVSTDLSIGVSMRYWATDGNVENVTLDNVRILFGDTEFWTGTTEDFDITGAEFDGVVMDNTQVYIDYQYQNTVQEGFHEHCNEQLSFEIDVSYGAGTALDTMFYSGDSVTVTCINE
jgi:hypothetical protein